MPTPNQGESREDFVSRCIPIVLEDGTAQDNDQAVAVCNSMFEKEDEKSMAKIKDYHTLPGFETKTIPTFIKSIDEDLGIVEHIISVFGIVDDGFDVVEPGSFTKTITEHGTRVKVLDQHRTDSVLRVVGKPLSMKEIPKGMLPPEVLVKYPEATGGLLAKTQYALETENGRDVFKLVKGGFLPETSFGYDALDTQMVRRTIEGQDRAVRLLKTIRLWEYSNVIWGMNPATTTLSAKENGKEITNSEEGIMVDDKGASGNLELPLVEGGEISEETEQEEPVQEEQNQEPETTEEKAGRRVSKRDEDNLRSVIQGLQSAIDSINGMFPVVDDEPEDETMELDDSLNTMTVSKENDYICEICGAKSTVTIIDVKCVDVGKEHYDTEQIGNPHYFCDEHKRGSIFVYPDYSIEYGRDYALHNMGIDLLKAVKKQTEHETDEAGPIDDVSPEETDESPTEPEVKESPFDFDKELAELEKLKMEVQDNE